MCKGKKKKKDFLRIPALITMSIALLFGSAKAVQGFSFNGGVSYWDGLCWVGFTAGGDLTEELSARGSFYYTTNEVSHYRAAVDLLYTINLVEEFCPYTGGGVCLSSHGSTNMHILAGIKVKAVNGYFRAEAVYAFFNPKRKSSIGVNLDFSWHVWDNFHRRAYACTRRRPVSP